MTAAERLAHPCPKCHAKPGAPCVDPLGDIMPKGHAIRGPGAHEAHKAAEAARINARAAASYGALFQDLAAAELRPVTAAELIERDRTAAARAFDATGGPSGLALLRQCNRGLEWLWVHHVARALAQLAGPAAQLPDQNGARTALDWLDAVRVSAGITEEAGQTVCPYCGSTDVHPPVSSELDYCCVECGKSWGDVRDPSLLHPNPLA